MELKCSDSVTWGGRKAGKFISGPSRLSWPLSPSLCLRAIFDNKKRVAMELKCSDSVTWGGRKAGKFISGPSLVVISCKWMQR